jgi:hypothetical protein
MFFVKLKLKGYFYFFTECSVFICDFHREQAWIRWLSSHKHGVESCKQGILQQLRRIASATTTHEMETMIQVLKSSALWSKHEQFSKWFERKWLANREVTCCSLLQILAFDMMVARHEATTKIQ